MQTRMDGLVLKLSSCLKHRGEKITTVESCTGGRVAALFTDFAGSSNWFDRGFVTYSNLSKTELVGVAPDTLEKYGAVSVEVALEMAIGGVQNSAAKYALSITGVAGPDGGSDAKPVGMVCFGWAGFNQGPQTLTKYFQGDRRAIREQSVTFSVQETLNLLAEH